MLSKNQIKKIDPTLNDLPDNELDEILSELYELGKLSLEAYFFKKANTGFQIGNKGLL